jgi:hypothetical protein
MRVRRSISILGAIATCLAATGGCRSEPPQPTADSARAAGSARTTPAKKGGGSALWVMAENAFAVGDVDGDAHEDIIGLCSDKAQGQVSFCAFRGVDLSLSWKLGAIRRDLAHATHIVATGKHGLLIDPGATARVVTLADGKEVASIQLTDRPKETCAVSERSIWLRLVDESELLIDTVDHKTTKAARPASCRSTDMGNVAMCMALGDPTNAACRSMPLPGPIDGMLAFRVAYDGAVGALIGTHSPGTNYSMVAAFDIRDGAATLRFKRALAEGSPLAAPPGDNLAPLALRGGRIFAKYDKEVVALDATTGKTLWKATPGAFMTLHSGATRIYVGRWSALAVYAASDGKAIGTIGVR